MGGGKSDYDSKTRTEKYGGDKLLESLARHAIKFSPHLDENSIEEY